MQGTLYHTVEDRSNPDDIEESAPFKCTKGWLGDGYYFWDTFIINAHWWGDHCYNGSYIICKTEYKIEDNEFLDLVGNTSQMEEFRNIVNTIKEEYCAEKDITVPFVIKWLQNKKLFRYKAIRANGVRSKSNKNAEYTANIRFTEGNHAYLDLCPPIQVCVIDKSILVLPMKIVYPHYYCDGYTI